MKTRPQWWASANACSIFLYSWKTSIDKVTSWGPQSSPTEIKCGAAWQRTIVSLSVWFMFYGSITCGSFKFSMMHELNWSYHRSTEIIGKSVQTVQTDTETCSKNINSWKMAHIQWWPYAELVDATKNIRCFWTALSVLSARCLCGCVKVTYCKIQVEDKHVHHCHEFALMSILENMIAVCVK